MNSKSRTFVDLKALFMFDPRVTFLNHGSFGATPRPVFKEYQRWQEVLEWQPVQFLGVEIEGHLANARVVLADYLRVNADDLVFVPNATFALNIVARSLDLVDGDEVLTTNHEYGACNNVWQFLSRKRGFNYRPVSVPLPLPGESQLIDLIWQAVSPRTRVLFISHISSSTASCFPVQALCARAREAGILSVVDGAHTPGQIGLDVEAIGADFYLGNCHKWLCSPKGAGFLYARREVQHLIEPLVVGWGWGDDRAFSYGSDYLDYLQWLGTNDLSAYLSVPEAIRFQEAYDWTAVRQRCHALLQQAERDICELTGMDSLYGNSQSYHQMAIAPLPQLRDLKAMKQRLYGDYQVEVPLIEWQGMHFIRVSVQGYNRAQDIDVLLEALRKLLPHFRN